MDHLDTLYDVGTDEGRTWQLVVLPRYAMSFTCNTLKHFKQTNPGSTLAYLPSTFTTPMFWNESDFKELQATAIAGTSIRLLT